MADSNAIEVGIRIDVEQGVAFFGVEDVNRQLRAGRRIKELRAGGAIVHKVGEDKDDVQLQLGGCDLLVVFAED